MKNLSSSSIVRSIVALLTIGVFILIISCDEKSTSQERLANAEMAGAEIAGQEIAGQEIAGQEIAGQEIAGQEIAGQEIAGAEATHTMTLSDFTLWRAPTETYIQEATSAIGSDIDRGIHDLFVFNNQLHIGYGDADLNAGGVSPIKLLSYSSPEAEITIDPLETGEEGIYRYRLIDGELMIAGVDSTDADELTSRPLIEGNFLRTRDGAWEKHRAIQGGEHVHDVTRFMEGLWAVGSGADNRIEWETYGVYRYLWFSGDGGVTWRRYKRVFREVPGDTRFINLLAVGPRLYIFGYLNPSADGEPSVPKNEVIIGATGEPTPLITGQEEGRSPEEAHPLANIYVIESYPLSPDLGVISGFDIQERSWRTWRVYGDGRIEVISEWEGLRLIDLSIDQESGSLLALFNNSMNLEADTGKIMLGDRIESMTELAIIDFNEGSRPTSIVQWGELILIGQEDGQIVSALLQ